jgi:DnaK suppressor protein
VNSKTERLDKSFIERQRQRLTKLRDELADATQGKEAEEKDINSQSSGEAVEYEDDAQRLATLELDGNLVARNAQRLAQVDRALEKIAEGTYGLSDASNHAIPRERLEATPEAIYTAAEQVARESAGPRGSGQK